MCQESVRIGERIRTARRKAGMSQEEVAKEIGLSNKSSISRVERGLQDPPMALLRYAAEHWGTSVGFLIGAREPEADPRNLLDSVDALLQSAGLSGYRLLRPDDSPAGDLGTDESKIVAIYRQMPPEQRIHWVLLGEALCHPDPFKPSMTVLPGARHDKQPDP